MYGQTLCGLCVPGDFGWSCVWHVLGVMEYSMLGCPGGVTKAEAGMGQGDSRAIHEENTLAG